MNPRRANDVAMKSKTTCMWNVQDIFTPIDIQPDAAVSDRLLSRDRHWFNHDLK